MSLRLSLDSNGLWQALIVMSDAAFLALSDYVFGISPMTESPKVTMQSFRASKILLGWRQLFGPIFKKINLFAYCDLFSGN